MSQCASSRSKFLVLLVCTLALVPISGCNQNSQTPEQSPQSYFENLESKLLGAKSVQIEFSVTAEGAFTASLTGTLDLQPGNKVELSADGTFGGTPVSLRLSSNGTQMTGGNGETSFDLPTAAALNEAILIGATRMGLLHNLSQLVAAAPPDHADGGAKEWVQTSDYTAEPSKQLAGQVARGVKFSIAVSGQTSGDATLWLNEKTGLPIERTQVIHFGTEDMLVTEKYTSVKIE